MRLIWLYYIYMEKWEGGLSTLLAKYVILTGAVVSVKLHWFADRWGLILSHVFDAACNNALFLLLFLLFNTYIIILVWFGWLMVRFGTLRNKNYKLNIFFFEGINFLMINNIKKL